MSNKKYILGDCMTYLKEYKDNHFDLAIVDPPYGLDIYNSGSRFKRYKKIKDNWDSKIPTKQYFDQIFRVSKNQIIWGGNYFTLPACRCFVIWDKKQPEKISFSSCEFAWTSFQKPSKTFYKSPQTQGKKIHPTQKPIKLYRWLLQNYAKPNDLILDTHVGSASSLIACEIEGFDYVGFEKDSDYYRDSTKRLKQHLSQITMF